MKGQQQGRSTNSGRGRGMGVRANAAQAIIGRTVEAATEVDKGGLAGLSAEQWQTLVNMLESQKGNSSERMTGKEVWIIDTGASNHMTGNLKLLQDLKDVQGCPVGLPDGQKVLATKEGTTTLDGGLKLSNVLYVPKLNCSLISVTQLIDETNCIMQFTNSLCVMQDRTSRVLIGLGEQIDGLYYFKGIRHEKAFKVDSGLSFDLWHRRMGHPSSKITELVSNISSRNNDYRNKACMFAKELSKLEIVFL
jgi:hypothetical protein